MQATHARVFRFFFDQPHTKFSRDGIVNHHSDIHPLVANQIRNVTDDVVRKRVRFSHKSPPTPLLISNLGKAAGTNPAPVRSARAPAACGVPAAQAERTTHLYRTR